MFRYIQALFKRILTHIQNLLNPWHIQNLGIFLSKSILYSDSMVYLYHHIKYFQKAQSWTCDAILNALFFYRCYLTIPECNFTVSLTLSFRRVQTYSKLIQPCLVLLRHITSSGIFRDILLQPYSGVY